MPDNPSGKIKASIIGCTGYTGLELIRILLAHPQVEIAHLVSRSNSGEDIGDTVAPHLKGYGLTLTDLPAADVAKDSDVVFLALPHKTAQDIVADLYGTVKIIDLSADYRLDDAKTYEHYYKIPHNHPDLLKKSVYGAPEFHRSAIQNAALVANPGCFALLAQLMLYPFAGQIERSQIFAVTGSSGSGRAHSDGTHHPVRSHNMKSYNINLHRHIPEITRTAEIEAGQLNFIPTSGPFTRGIFMQGFIDLKKETTPNCAADLYKNEPFIRVTDNVALAHIAGSNFVDLSYQKGNGDTVLVQGALDNLVKGAAGCAVQNMNLMFGLKETDGLTTLAPLYP